jgi:Family of unknown function (DUF5681)
MAKRPASSKGVGYGKPPAATRFKPGQSGNAKGRPRGSKNLITAIQRELGTRIPVTVNGARQTITKKRAVIAQLVNKAAAGDPRLMSILLRALNVNDDETSSRQPEEVLNRREDQMVLESIVRRIWAARPLSEPDTSSTDPQQPESLKTPTDKPEDPK